MEQLSWQVDSEAHRMLTAPVAVRPEWLSQLADAFGRQDRTKVRAVRFGWDSALEGVAVDRGVAIVTIKGALVQGSWIRDYSTIRDAMRIAASSDDVHAILLDIDSPGGDVHDELFALAEDIREIRKSKTVYAIANEMAASAAYVIASQADKVFASSANTSILGSMGVIAVHADWSAFNERVGVKFTEVVTGKHKNDLSQDAPLSKGGRETMERMVDAAFDELISAVTAGRPSLTETMIKDMQAAIYLGSEAKSEGLADGVVRKGALVEMLAKRGGFARAAAAVAKGRGNKAAAKRNIMDETNVATPDADVEVAADADAAHEAPVIDLEAERKRLRGEAEAEVRAFVKAVTELCSLAGLPHLASKLIDEDGMTVDLARQRLVEARAATGSDEINNQVEANKRIGEPVPSIDSFAIYRRWNGQEK